MIVNLDNCKFVSIFDEYKEINFINRYHNIFDSKLSQFVTSDLLKADVEEKYNDKLSKLDKEDIFYEIKLQTIKTERQLEAADNLEAAEKFDKQKKKKKKRTKLIDFMDRKNEALPNQKVKSLIDFDEEYTCSIKSVAIEKSSKINLTTRFLNGKMSMFSKVSIKSFVYDLIDVFMFPNQEIQEIYRQYQVNKCFNKVIYIKTELIQIVHQCFLFLHVT